MSYSKELQREMEKEGIEIGDRIKVLDNGKEHTGILMPRTESDEDTLVLKLDGGYNIGLKHKNGMSFKKLEDVEVESKDLHVDVKKSGDKSVSILIAGGTIASRVDYRTGAVKPSVNEDEFVTFAPEIGGIAKIETRKILNTLSENIGPEDWKKIAEEVVEEIEKGKDGVVIAHGTDTMGYTSAALSFMLENLPIPVVLVGSQRSSDRGSSDAHQNLTCALKAATTDIAEVTVCMHGSRSDDFCYLHPGTKVRKMHTSRRDAFRTVNADPYAKIYWEDLKVERIRNDYRKKNTQRKVEAKSELEGHVEIIRIYPGMDPGIFEKKLQRSKGVVIEGTGMGHIPTDNKEIMEELKKYIEEGNIAFMASQCFNGRINMNVYETGIDLQKAGVIGNLSDMLPETAYVKLAWLLGNYDKEEAEDLMTENMRGEITERSVKSKF